MAIKNFFYSVAAVSFSVVFLSACQSTPVRQSRPSVPARPSPGRPQTPLSQSDFNDQVEEDYPNPPTPQQPAEPAPHAQSEAPKKVAVILGPGGAKAFAHIGVLKALNQNRIPVDKVVGLEWGALVGALFAAKGQVHDLEWKMYRMEQNNLPYPKGLFTKGPGEQSVKVMDGFLHEALGREDVGAAKVPFACPSRTIWTGALAWQTRGSMADAVKRCLPYPPVFKAQGTFIAGASAAREAAEKLIKEGYNVVILVNVLGSAMPLPQDGLLDNLNHVILWQEVKGSMTDAAKYNLDVINVDTSSFPVVGFGSKKDLIVLGERAGAAAASALISKYRF